MLNQEPTPRWAHPWPARGSEIQRYSLQEPYTLRTLFRRLELDHATVRADAADYVTPLLAFFRARARRLG